jgi:serine phosphatase RsbU (regulator of sigma subunit)
METAQKQINIEVRQGQFSWDLEKEGFYFFGIPSVLLWTNPSMLKMLQPLAQEVGFDMFRLMVAHSSSFGTTEDYNNVVMPLGNGDFVEGFYAWGRVVSSIGWGNVHIEKFDVNEKKALVRVRNPWELSMQAQESEHWGCPFMQGKIIGLFSAAFGLNCWAYEQEIHFDKNDLSNNFVMFRIEPSDKTISQELEKLRLERMDQKERLLTDEVNKKTKELLIAQAQLEEYSKNLERKVQERTLQLQETIEEINQINEELETQADELNRQKELLESKNWTITQSINYAKRIQNATLSSLESIASYLPKSFVWYFPRDIISGDFYWFEKIQNAENQTEIVMAVGDCTGHGVSGCLMSMIGINNLHQVINEKRIHDPAQILKELDRKVRKILGQDDQNNEIQDGMDLALCIYNPANKQLLFASAKRPLWLFRKEKLEEIKGNNLPIGSSFHEEKNFVAHTFRLEEGDRIYLFSDGLVDQFDNLDLKRLTSKGLRKILISLQEMPLQEQKMALSEHFEQWKGKNRQTDDLVLFACEV